jgi:hypothetical protein
MQLFDECTGLVPIAILAAVPNIHIHGRAGTEYFVLHVLIYVETKGSW